MWRFFKLLLVLSIAANMALCAAVALVIEDDRAVPAAAELTPDQLGRARQLFAEHDPRQEQQGTRKTITVTGSEANLAANYVVLQAQGSAAISLNGGSLSAKASFPIPKNPLGRFINVEIELRDTDALPTIHHLKLGALPVPGWITGIALQQLAAAMRDALDEAPTHDAIQRVSFSRDTLEVTYVWHQEYAEAVRSSFVSDADQQRLRTFQRRLADIVNGLPAGPTSLEAVTLPLFVFASQRSEIGTSSPVADNRAALLALSAYVNGRKLARLAPDVDDWTSAKKLSVRTQGRADLPKHYLTSAALAATGGTALSQVVGLFKEAEDSRGGSGFSFADLLADEAGTRLGELATTSQATARAVQQYMATAAAGYTLLPTVRGLPEGLRAREFERKYTEIGSPAYNAVHALIEKRIAANALYRR